MRRVDKAEKAGSETSPFKPVTYTIKIWGTGAEIVMGHVPRATYDYFVENGIDVEELAQDSDNELDIPEKHRFIANGDWHSCDDIAHHYGPDMESSKVTVYDENGNSVWDHDLNIDDLKKSGIQVDVHKSRALRGGAVVYSAVSEEKGLFFEGEINLESPFDPKRLRLACNEINGWTLCNRIEYNGKDIGSDNLDTNGIGLSCELKVIPQKVKK